MLLHLFKGACVLSQRNVKGMLLEQEAETLKKDNWKPVSFHVS